MKMILAFLLFAETCFATGVGNSDDPSLRTWKRGTAVVLFAGVGGGILGLSTLSFYGQPQEHTSNISTGALIGAILGGAYVIFDANRPAPAPLPYVLNIDRRGTSLARVWEF